MSEEKVKIAHPYSHEKFYLHAKKLELLDQGLIPAPVTVDIDLTDVCDHKCPWCEYANFRKKSSKYLPLPLVQTLLDDLSNSPVDNLIFAGGGEPTLHPNFGEISRQIAEKNFKAILYTHGEHIHQYVHEISSAFLYVRVSLDAGSAFTHSMHHASKNKMAFRQIFNNLEALKELNPNIKLGLSILLTEHSMKELEKLTEPSIVNLVNFLLVKFSRFQSENLWVTPENLEEIEFQVDQLRKHLPTYYRSPNAQKLGAYPVKCCRTHFLKTLVAPDGCVYVCNQRRGDSSMALGSLFEDRFWNVWNREYHKLVANQIDTNLCPPCRHIGYNELADKIEQFGVPEVEFTNDIESLLNFL